METSEASATHDSSDQRPFAGKDAWLITEGNAGGIQQLRGVAAALGVVETIKTVSPRQPWSVLAPYGPISPWERFGRAGAQFAPPWPEIAIATGRQSIPYLRALRRNAGASTFTVVLQNPKAGAGIADLVCIPAHDRLDGPNVVRTLTAAHPFSPARLASLRAQLKPEIEALPAPRIAVILGGPNAVYRYTDDSAGRLATALRGIAGLGASFLVTPSRRTPPALRGAIAEAVAGAPHLLWDGTGENPYPAFLAHADMFVVTADSVNMCGEACATGRPVYVFTPEGGSPKFGRFHARLESYGATRKLPARPERIESWSYRPLDAAAEIAAEIERRAGAR